MNKASKTLLLALSLSLAACGGSPDAKSPADTAVVGANGDATAVAVGDAATPSLPNVPATPVEAPLALTAVVTAGNPNSQITQIGTFVDAVMPGMAAFVTPQALMQQIEGIVGVVGLRGLDLNQPLHLLMLDNQQAVVVATVSSEAELNESLEGTSTKVMLHEGYAAIGGFDALHTAGAYALSNLVKDAVPALPTVALHLGKIMRGPHADEVRQQIAGQMNGESGAMAAEITLALMSNIEVLSLDFDANQETATVRLTGAGIGGDLKDFIGKQNPASYAMMQRLGTGPWAMSLGGRLDLTPFIPLLVSLGEAQAQPIVTQIAAQLGGLNGEMGMNFNLVPNRELVMGVELAAGNGLGPLVDNLLAMVSKQKDLDFDGMKGNLKLGAIKTRAGSLHELKLTPTTDQLKKDYGNGGVSAFFGIVADTMIATFGPSAKAQAKTLSAKSGTLTGKGAMLGKAIEQSKSLNESFMMAFDAMSLQGTRPAADQVPLVIGVGFTADSFTGRLVIPAAVVKEAAAGAF